MSEYRKDDLVEATRNDDVIRGRINYGCGGGAFVGASKWTTDALAEHNWSISIIEGAPELVPTKRGAYFDRDGSLWVLTADGGWLDFSLWNGGEHPTGPKSYLPLTPARPEAETAKAVLVALEERYGDDYYHNSDDGWNDVAKQFGVTT